MRTTEQIKTDIQNAVNSLRAKDSETALETLTALKEELKQAERIKMLTEVNRKQATLRELAKTAWNCEQPTEDITTNDGSFHKVKIKKYPILASVPYLYAKFKDNHLTELSISGEKFQMYAVKYDYPNPNQYTRPESFEQFLELNSIQAEDITPQQFNVIVEQLEQAEGKLKEAVKQYETATKKLDVYQLNHLGLLRQSNERLYTYSPNH